ncbi:MAG: UDP-N-acetylglucosamine 1-carboxyvinyltransferase [Clostridia bacterium]|nr:UDP-N-acetylglucosamine 1-carboxyvinyltransferase [Clostridia bacterium]
MSGIIIKGQNKLNGEVNISGMKNSAVAIILSCIAIPGVFTIRNVPQIDDVKTAKEILLCFGATIYDMDEETIRIDSTNVKNATISKSLMQKMRASYYVAGASLTRFGEFSIHLPGGCNIGKRPIDQHLKAFKAMGAEVCDGNIISAKSNDLDECCFTFDFKTVGGTINAILASLRLKKTILKNVAQEPYIGDLIDFLNCCGANITGFGTDELVIKGIENINNCSYTIMPDYIEAGTYIAATAIAGGNVKINNVVPSHLEKIVESFSKIGIEVLKDSNSLRVISNGEYRGTNIETAPYPGFPTDMQPIMAALLSAADGESTIKEKVFENRFGFIGSLNKMGADITQDGDKLYITGVEKLSGASIEAVDLRAGAALIVAALGANGITTITNEGHIMRGYPLIVNKLKQIGANIDYIN